MINNADEESDTLVQCEIMSLSLFHAMKNTKVVQYLCTVSNGQGCKVSFITVIQPVNFTPGP